MERITIGEKELNENTHREINRRLADAWMFGICAVFLTCSLDFIEKVAVFLLGISFDTPRPLHTLLFFGLFSLVFALGSTASYLRQSNLK